MNNSNLFVTATDARNNFFELLEKVKNAPYAINITVKGIPEAVVVNKEEYDSWLATIETLSDKDLMEAVNEGDKDLKAGRYSSWEKVKKELRLGNGVSSKSFKTGNKSLKKA